MAADIICYPIRRRRVFIDNHNRRARVRQHFGDCSTDPTAATCNNCCSRQIDMHQKKIPKDFCVRTA